MGKSGGTTTSVRERASRGAAPSASSKAATLSKNGKRVGRPPAPKELNRVRMLQERYQALDAAAVAAHRVGDRSARNALMNEREAVAQQLRNVRAPQRPVNDRAALQAADQHLRAFQQLSFAEQMDIARTPGGYRQWVASHFVQ